MRRGTWASLCALAVLTVLTGCEDGPSAAPAGKGDSSSASDASGDRPKAPYDAELVAEGDAQSQGPARMITLDLTNTGRFADRYIVQLTPPDAGQVAPSLVRLRPGQRQALQVWIHDDGGRPSGAPQPDVRVVVHSTTTNEDVTTLDMDG